MGRRCQRLEIRGPINGEVPPLAEVLIALIDRRGRLAYLALPLVAWLVGKYINVRCGWGGYDGWWSYPSA